MVVPSFFKIMVGDFKSALRLPRLFVKKFEGVLPDKALLETKYGESWSINIEKIGEDYCFNHGWAQFVSYHQLAMCDLLLFKPIPEEKLAFRVLMFGPSACEKEITFDTQCDSLSNSDPENIAKHQEDTSSSSTSMASQEHPNPIRKGKWVDWEENCEARKFRRGDLAC